MASTDVAAEEGMKGKRSEQVETVCIRFCGDSGDGMQLVGTQFTNVSAAFGNDVSTLPDFPAEIRAPAGTLGGVSGFQLSFSSRDIFTPGDRVDTLVAMNPAALKTNLADLKRGGTLIVNEDAFDKTNVAKAGYDQNPLDDEEQFAGYRFHKVPMTRLTRDAVEGLGLSTREAERSKNFFALGLVYWLYDRNPTPTTDWIKSKFAKNPSIADANLQALKAGSDYGLSTETFTVHYQVAKAKLTPGKYRKMTGNEAVAFGLASAARVSGKTLFFGGYPITPASEILQELTKLKNFGVRTFQAEDEIAAMAACVGAAFAGEFSTTATSGPGLCLKSEAIGLGVITELPMVIVNVQRGGPSTGLPTKPEQGDLLQSLFGRNGDSPVPVLAAASPADCFAMAYEAMRIAVGFMTPVILLTDGYIGFGAEPWAIPDVSDLKPIKFSHPTECDGNGKFLPYTRDERLIRPWALPGTPGLEHRIGGLEKSNISGSVDYSPANHQLMTEIRAKKVAGVVDAIPEQDVRGPERGELLVLSWGGAYGAARDAVEPFLVEGKSVAHAHLRYLHPFPGNLGDILRRYDKILIPEMNTGHLRFVIRGTYLIDAQGLNKIQGKPFLVGEIADKIEAILEDKTS